MLKTTKIKIKSTGLLWSKYYLAVDKECIALQYMTKQIVENN